MIWLLLAAGRAERFGSAKLLAEFAGGRLIDPAIEALQATGHSIHIVVRVGDTALLEHLRRYPHIHSIEATTAGLGDSIAAGVRAVLNQPEAAADAGIRQIGIALADMPGLTQTSLAALVALAEPELIVRPLHAVSGQPGHPVLFGSAVFPDLLECSGDDGAMAVIAANRSRLVELTLDDAGCFTDIDTPGQLTEWSR